MFNYILRRLLLIVPTLFGIMALNFLIIQAAPGGPVEQMIAKLEGMGGGASDRVGGSARAEISTSGSSYRGKQGLDPEMIAKIEKMYGFDKSAWQRFKEMTIDYASFNFGESFFRSKSVTDLIAEKMPVSISIGLWTTLITYLISIPMGIKKAVRHGEPFDIWTSSVIIIGYAIPSFLFAMLLIVLFAGGSYWTWFPLRGLVSPNFDELSLFDKALDYAWHLVLPVTSLVIGGFATLTMLTKNSFLDEIGKQYVITAKAKGLTERQVLYRHVFRNAMLIVISGFPTALLGILFTEAFLIEIIFSLDGLGLLGFESVLTRDYPVVFGTLFIFTLVTLIMNIVSDVVYTLVDPRIDFEARH
ncbi:ABC transporter, permease protein [gamma proteobacterium HdN1]|nr:ABC transporter, permease protein [gamma proteobacterium HdN1]